MALAITTCVISLAPLQDTEAQAWALQMRRSAEALFQLIGMQLSVPLYAAECTERGANLDQMFFPLNNSPYLLQQLANISALPTENERVSALLALARWDAVTSLGFHDDLGVSALQPHLVVGEGAATDPQFFRTAENAYSTITSQCAGSGSTTPPSFPTIPQSWLTLAKSMYDLPLSLQYTGLLVNTSYSLTVVYANGAIGQGDGPIRMLANGAFEVHAWISTPVPMAPLRFGIPGGVVSENGTLLLQCFRQWDWTQSPSHSGCAVSEVWLEPDV